MSVSYSISKGRCGMPYEKVVEEEKPLLAAGLIRLFLATAAI